MELPETQYAHVAGSDTVVAYQVFGEGPDLVIAPPILSHVEFQWEEPHFARFLTRLASFCRVIMFDKRGTGLSDAMPGGRVPTLEERMDDMLAVMDTVGAERPTLFGYGEGGPLCVLFSATYPDRAMSLILCNATARTLRDDDYPWGWDPNPEENPPWQGMAEWGKSVPNLERFSPTLVHDESFVKWYLRFQRLSASPSMGRELAKVSDQIDVRRVLPAVNVPTLVMHRKDNMLVSFENGRYLADHIPGAKFVELPGVDHWPWMVGAEDVIEEIFEFVTGHRHEPEVDRVLATILFTDIVGSTERAAEIGDRRWRDLLEEHYLIIRRELERYRGREIDTAGDGFLAIFDGPARAIRSACSSVQSMKSLGIEIRAGLHTGECELVGNSVAGIAVHIAARVAALASASEILVSSTVKDLVAGSGIQFEDQGTKALKGVPEEWRVFSVVV
jgi:class 3 adenylate cyclase